VLATFGAITRTNVALTDPAYTYNREFSTRKAKTANAPPQCWPKGTKAALQTSRRQMSPPARQTSPLGTMGSLARKGAAPDQGAEAYTLLSEGKPTTKQATTKRLFFLPKQGLCNLLKY
jgi:hypothetical protein